MTTMTTTERCVTPRCNHEPAMTYLGNPLCQTCWAAECRETPNESTESAKQETDMSKKSTSRKPKSSKPRTAQPKARKAAAAVIANAGPAAAAAATAKAKPTKKSRAQQAAAEPKPKRVSALDAAAQVLQASGQAMRAGELIAALAEQGLWHSPNGKTPAATLYAAMLREINTKSDAARFCKVERGKFKFHAAAQAQA